MIADLDKEWWLAKRLREHGARIFDGVTTPEVRKQRVREAIALVGSSVVVGRGKDRKPVTYQQAFEKLYDEPLIPPPTKAKERTEAEPGQTVEGSTK